jgi:threonine/homoserine/homoserine lactone efflux protein
MPCAMTLELFFGLFVFAGIAAFTPGPNNTLLMASGMNFGFRRTLPLVLGVAIGFPLMIGLVGLGLGRVFEAYPVVYATLKYAGAAYMVFLAWKIANAKPSGANASENVKPLSFMQMMLFQWVNPKGWIMAVTALTAYTVASHYYIGVATVVATFVFMGITSALTWAGIGSALESVMKNPRFSRYINLAMAALLLLSLLPMLFH